VGADCEGSGASGAPTLQIHPSRHCNLRCLHCYSESAPQSRETLPTETVLETIADAGDLGYRVVSVSGGEPFLYPGLAELLRYAKSRGLHTTVTTNGYFLKPRWLDPLHDLIDTLALSLDGPPDFHNAMRGSPEAFDRLTDGIRTLGEFQIPFGIIHTVTSQNWQHLSWTAEFASSHGARLLQLHPLELSGRAEAEFPYESPGHDVLSRLYLLSFVLASQYAERMAIQCDLLHRQYVLADPELIYSGELQGDLGQRCAARLLSLLILEPDGAIVPVSYGFGRDYQVCNVRQHRLSNAWPGFIQNGYPKFRRLCRQLFDDVVEQNVSPLFNWYEEIVNRSNRAGIREPVSLNLFPQAILRLRPF
jgi:Fe-coproporphyrin III synthase